MGLETAAFLVGVLLVGVALLGGAGGIEVKEIKIPKVSRFARVLAGCAGVVFILIGLHVKGTITIPFIGTTDPNNSSGEISGQTPFILKAQLGDFRGAKEIETQITVFIEGRKVAEFYLDPDSPSDSKTLGMDKPGKYRYSIDGYTKWSTNPDKIRLAGSDTIGIVSGRTYLVSGYSAPSSTTKEWHVFIRKVND